jgi:hypothetical protein
VGGTEKKFNAPYRLQKLLLSSSLKHVFFEVRNSDVEPKPVRDLELEQFPRSRAMICDAFPYLTTLKCQNRIFFVDLSISQNAACPIDLYVWPKVRRLRTAHGSPKKKFCPRETWQTEWRLPMQEEISSTEPEAVAGGTRGRRKAARSGEMDRRRNEHGVREVNDVVCRDRRE